MNCLHSLRTKTKHEKPHEKACKNKIICNIRTPNEENKISEFVKYLKHI